MFGPVVSGRGTPGTGGWCGVVVPPKNLSVHILLKDILFSINDWLY